jgi:ferredoxin
MDAAQCIGCGACVAACKNASAMLFVAAKVSHLGLLPQGQPERDRRVLAMVQTMDGLGFGGCTNQYECSAACPKLISHDFIARMNRDYAKAIFRFEPVSGPRRAFPPSIEHEKQHPFRPRPGRHPPARRGGARAGHPLQLPGNPRDRVRLVRVARKPTRGSPFGPGPRAEFRTAREPARPRTSRARGRSRATTQAPRSATNQTYLRRACGPSAPRPGNPCSASCGCSAKMKLTNRGSRNRPRESFARPNRMAGRWKRFLSSGCMGL